MLEQVITAFLSAIFGALSAILIARYSKTKEERDSGLAADYLKIADMTGDQLEKKINLISTLDCRLDEIEKQRDERGEEIKELHVKIEKLNREYAAQVAELNQRIAKEEDKNALYKTIIEKLIIIIDKSDPKLLDGVDLPETIQKIRAIRK